MASYPTPSPPSNEKVIECDCASLTSDCAGCASTCWSLDGPSINLVISGFIDEGNGRCNIVNGSYTLPPVPAQGNSACTYLLQVTKSTDLEDADVFVAVRCNTNSGNWTVGVDVNQPGFGTKISAANTAAVLSCLSSSLTGSGKFTAVAGPWCSSLSGSETFIIS